VDLSSRTLATSVRVESSLHQVNFRFPPSTIAHKYPLESHTKTCMLSGGVLRARILDIGHIPVRLRAATPKKFANVSHIGSHPQPPNLISSTRTLEMDDRAETFEETIDHQHGKDRGKGRAGGGGRAGRGHGRGGGGGRGNREMLVSKALSKLLRHQAVSAGIQLDREGYAALDKVVSALL